MNGSASREQRVIVRGLLERNGRVLIIEERAELLSSREYYDFPGGAVPFGQDPKEALRDLFYEQTRIPVSVLEPFRITHRVLQRGTIQVIEITYRVASTAPIEAAEDGLTLKTQWVAFDDPGFFLSARLRESLRKIKDS